MMAKKKRKGSNIQEGSALGAEAVPGTTPTVLGAESVSKQAKSVWSSSKIKDARLIPRMKEFLEAKRNKKIVSISAIVDHLQSKYPEYGRKKKNVFAQYVEKAYAVLEKQISGEKAGSSGPDISGCSEIDGESSSESDSVEELLMEYKDTNAVNNMMSNLYRNSPCTVVPEQEEKKRKSELTDSVKKRQRTEDLIVRNKEISSTASPNKENASAVNFYIDRKGDSVQKGVTNSGDNSREIIQTHKGALPRDLTLATPIEVKDSNLELKSLKKDCKEIVQQSANMPISEIKKTGSQTIPLEITSTRDVEETKTAKSMDTSEVLGSVKQGTEIEATDTPSKPKKGRLTRRTKSRKQDDMDQEQEKSKKDKGPAVQKSTLTFSDVGGNEQNLQEICKLLVHMRHPEVYLKLGVTPPRGFLLHGPPGCGKTLLANAIAGELDLPLIKIAATEIVSGVSGDSEEKIRELFEKAVQCSPCVMFIDEIDAITPKRETASKDMERRIVAQLLACMDDLNANPDAQVLVIGATNRPDSLDPALRRAGRFDREICLGIPDEQSRLRILQVLCRGLRLSPDFDFLYLAKNSPGYVGADLMALTREAAMSAVNRVFQELQSQEDPEKSTPMETDGHDPSSDLQNSNCDINALDKPLIDTSDSNSKAALEELHADDPQKPGTEIQSAQTPKSNESLVNRPTVTDTSEESVRESGVLPSQLDSCDRVNGADTLNSGVNTSKESPLETAIGTGTDVAVKEDSVVTNTDSSPIGECQEEGTSISSGTRTNDSVLDVDNVKKQSGASVDVVARELGNEHPSDISTQERDDGMETVSSEHINHGEARTVKKKEPTLISVLSWLKEQPPLTEEQLNDLYINMEDFKEALEHVQPSAKREGFATVPDVTWDDIGALHQVREELQLAILAPVRHAEEFRSLGLNRAQGILLAGPPGCGKTLLAKAVANESGINFISVKGPELLNMYVGESEKAVRTVFQRARNSSPCVIFFDELDALCPRRSGTADSGSSSRVVNQLLTEMDGLEERKQVFIMAATNRPDIIDPAVLRPGRLDKTLYVGLPTKEDRLDIFKCITKEGTRPCLAQDVNLGRLAEDRRCDGFTGADLAALVREASVLALKKAILDKGRQPGETIIVKGEHFEDAFSKIKPSVSVKDRDKYRSLGQRITSVT